MVRVTLRRSARADTFTFISSCRLRSFSQWNTEKCIVCKVSCVTGARTERLNLAPQFMIHVNSVTETGFFFTESIILVSP